MNPQREINLLGFHYLDDWGCSRLCIFYTVQWMPYQCIQILCFHMYICWCLRAAHLPGPCIKGPPQLTLLFEKTERVGRVAVALITSLLTWKLQFMSALCIVHCFHSLFIFVFTCCLVRFVHLKQVVRFRESLWLGLGHAPSQQNSGLWKNDN